MKDTTLCLFVKRENGVISQILLAMKKRGFGLGKWNGVGGKVDKEKDKSIVGAIIREAKEEIGVSLENPEKVAIMRFRFPYKGQWNQDVHLFLAEKWRGEPQESEEMAPKWFKVSEIPYDKMWDTDKIWLPHILAGEKLKADFVFKKGEKTDKFDIKVVDNL